MAGFDVNVPEELMLPLLVQSLHLYGAGPANISPRVFHSLSLPVLTPSNRQYSKIMKEIRGGLQYVFQTKNDVTLAMTGSGIAGVEAALVNLLEGGDKLLVAVNGNWSETAAFIGEKEGCKICAIEKQLGEIFNLQEIEAGLIKYRPKVFFIVHGESSAAVLQPLEGIGDLCHRYNCLFIVDAVASLGAVPLFVDKWSIDVAVSASQKAMRGPAGLAPITFSSRAIQCVRNRKTPVRVYFFDILLLAAHWECFDGPKVYHHTICSNLCCALREAIAELCEEGIQNAWKRQMQCSLILRNGLMKLGMEMFIEDDSLALPWLVVVKLPLPGKINETEFLEYMTEKLNIELMCGVGPSYGKVLRIGSLGYNAQPQKIKILLDKLAEGLHHFGVTNENEKNKI